MSVGPRARAVPADITAVIARIRAYRFLSSAEAELQQLLAKALDREGIVFVREHPIADGGRIDFFLPHYAAGVEVKIKGSPMDVLRQLQAYALDPALQVLVLATARARLTAMPSTIAGKPLHVLPLTGGLL